MKLSAGILLFRRKDGGVEILLVHPGGPFWKNKDAGAWSIPKGEFTETEPPLEAAKREFTEETGFTCDGPFIELNPLKQKSGKIIYAFATEKDIDAAAISSNTFQMVWPPKSGILTDFPEADKAQWFPVNEALLKINTGQAKFIKELVTKIS
ncbi:NUDIX domain-containing protein [soil metagenome]